MKIFHFLVLVCLLLSCRQNEEKHTYGEHKPQDSVQHYYTMGKDKGLSLYQRHKALRKVLYLTGKSRRDSIYYNTLYQKNSLHFVHKEYDSLLVYNQLLLKSATENTPRLVLAKQYYLMGYYYGQVAQQPDSAFANYNTSKKYFEKIRDSNGVGKNLLNMGTLQKNQNDFFGSKETLIEAIPYIKKNKDSLAIAALYNILATNHRKLLNFKEAEDYYLKAIETTNNANYRLVYKNNLGASYVDNKMYAEGIAIFNAILQDSNRIKNQKEYARVLDNLAYAKWCSAAKVVEKEFLKALNIRKQHKDKRGLLASYSHLGAYNCAAKPKLAIRYFDTVIRLSKEIRAPRAEADALKFLMKVAPKNIAIRDRYVFLQDSLYEQELKVKTQFAKYKYDDKLTKEENLRLEKENAQKVLESSKQRNYKILYLGGFICTAMVFLLSLFAFNQRTKGLKQKNKADRLQAVQETEAELSRKLHDDYGGKLNQLMTMMQRGVSKEYVLDALEALYKHTRNFSRSLNTVDTGPNFWKVLKATLEFAKPIDVKMTFNGAKEIAWAKVSHQTKVILFKVLQELIINMAKHSKAHQVVLIFNDHHKMLHVYYEDDGVGASKEALYRKNGLKNTEKRTKAIGGSIIFDSEPGKGFRAEINIPK